MRVQIYSLVPRIEKLMLSFAIFTLKMQIKSFFSVRNLFIFTLLVFVAIALRSWLVPFNHDESATFYFYIQRGEFIPYYSVPDANNHVLNSFSGYYFFKIFGDSPFALRLPSLLSFIVLAFAVYRLSFHLKNLYSKVFLFGSFLLSYHFLTFYGMCRGYGMSMAFYMLSFAFLFDYFKNQKFSFFAGTLIALQFAIAANMTLMIPALFITGMMTLFHFFQKNSCKWWIFPSYLIHLGIIFCWAKYSLFLQENGALYYGQGDSYWEVTFVTLIDLIFHTSNSILVFGIAVLFLAAMLLAIFKNLSIQPVEKIKTMHPFLFFTVMFPVLIAGFYILHVWKDVNFPEDRTALFYYPVAMLMVTFLIDQYQWVRSEFISRLLFVVFGMYFLLSLNFSIQSIPEYETFPDHWYQTLNEKQEEARYPITIGGHRTIELMWSFTNYNHDFSLNTMDDGEEMNLYCDYGIVHSNEKERVKDKYNILAENEWGMMLLERKKFCERKLAHSIPASDWREGKDEFFEYYRITDTVFTDKNPILTEFNFDIDHAATPFWGWIVFDLKDNEGKTVSYKRIPLNWISYSINGMKNISFTFLSGEIPKKPVTLVLYLWNMDKQFIKIKMNSIKMYRLEE